MTYTVLPVTDARRQAFSLEVSPDGIPLQAWVEIVWLRGIGRWVLSLRDLGSGELLVNRIPLLGTEKASDDLLYPFRHLRQGRGLGSLFCLKRVPDPGSRDPSADTLTGFQILWGDTIHG